MKLKLLIEPVKLQLSGRDNKLLNSDPAQVLESSHNCFLAAKKFSTSHVAPKASKYLMLKDYK